MPPTHTDEGLVAAAEIRSSYPEIGVLVLSQYLESRYAMRLLEQHLERCGYLLKERVSDIAVLADALKRISEGECVLDPTIMSRLVERPLPLVVRSPRHSCRTWRAKPVGPHWTPRAASARPGERTASRSGLAFGADVLAGRFPQRRS
jgi:hypothetical protein